MMKNRLIGACLLLVITSSPYAGTIICGGTVTQLAYHAPDKLMIRLSSMNVPGFFFNPDAEWSVTGTTYTTSAETCGAMYATFLSAKASGASITQMYFDGDDVPTTCNGRASWKSANIRHYIY